MITVEIACNSYGSCVNAVRGGADRIELFENLGDGGCTPSAGMIKKALTLQVPVWVMIRPRGGHFCYSTDETEIMLHDIDVCKQLGAGGIVFGCLTRTGQPDIALCQLLLRAWNGPAAFHRAIDRCADVFGAAGKIADMGFTRILSSGGASHVMNGLDTLRSLQETYGKYIRIMPGAGVTPDNAAQIISYTACREIHSTCKSVIDTPSAGIIPAFQDKESISDEQTVRSLVSIMHKIPD